MDTQTDLNNNKKNLKSYLFLLTPFFVLSFFLLYYSKGLIFAQESANNLNVEIEEYLYLPNTTKERASYGPKLISIKRGDEVVNVLTTLSKVEDILKDNGFTLEKNDYVYLNTQYVVDRSIIKIVRTSSVLFESLEEVPYLSETRESSNLLRGQENTIQKGVLGVKKEVYQNTYEDGVLVKSILVDEIVLKHPQKEIVEIGTSWYTLKGIEIRGYNCNYWYSVVDSGPYSPEEKEWLKFIMYCESGCNAESNKSSYKGLFQWSPYWWSKQFSENIYDGHAQIKHTIEKYRAGESTRASQWPACNAKYLREKK